MPHLITIIIHTRAKRGVAQRQRTSTRRFGTAVHMLIMRHKSEYLMHWCGEARAATLSFSVVQNNKPKPNEFLLATIIQILPDALSHPQNAQRAAQTNCARAPPPPCMRAHICTQHIYRAFIAMSVRAPCVRMLARRQSYRFRYYEFDHKSHSPPPIAAHLLSARSGALRPSVSRAVYTQFAHAHTHDQHAERRALHCRKRLR